MASKIDAIILNLVGLSCTIPFIARDQVWETWSEDSRSCSVSSRQGTIVLRAQKSAEHVLMLLTIRAPMGTRFRVSVNMFPDCVGVMSPFATASHISLNVVIVFIAFFDRAHAGKFDTSDMSVASLSTTSSWLATATNLADDTRLASDGTGSRDFNSLSLVISLKRLFDDS